MLFSPFSQDNTKLTGYEYSYESSYHWECHCADIGAAIVQQSLCWVMWYMEGHPWILFIRC